MTRFCLITSVIIGLCVACASPAPKVTPTSAPPIPAPTPTPLPPTAYRPIQINDIIEGAKIGYQYVLPSPEQPVAVVAFGEGMLELVTVKQQLKNGLIEYIQELAQEPHSIYAFDAANPAQTEPSLLTLAANKPVEIVILPLTSDPHTWSVTETDQGAMRAAYKLVRRQDGGLRFIDAYSIEAMNSFTTLLTLNGGGAGLVYSARVALLRLILSQDVYQRGTDVMASHPPQPSQYDPRILKLDPTQTGLAQDLDWVLVSRPGPNPGIVGP